MKSIAFAPASKFDLARVQLDCAIDFYLRQEDCPCAITLAGAAEELLGRLAQRRDRESALKRQLRESGALLDAFKADFDNDIKADGVVQQLNRARNELKHFCSGQDLHLDLEREAARLIARALENYVSCTGSAHPGQYAFDRQRLVHWRAKHAPT